MITISLCMIVRNEEKNLPRCLDSIRDLVEEIVIVDTGSTDGTKEAASRYTDRIFDYVWEDNFAAARNYAFSKATMDYCMWMDADDLMESEDRERFIALKKSLTPQVDVVMLRYHTAFDAGGKPTFTYYRERLIRRGAGFQWEGAVHEAIAPSGVVLYDETAVTHRKTGPGDPDRNLRIFQSLLQAGKALSPREQFYYARELTYHGEDLEAVQVFEAFLNSGQGWIENQLEACRNLAQCYFRLGKPEQAFSALLRSLRYAPPRAELCCELGKFFFDRADYKTAVFWYEQALACRREDTTGGFIIPDCYDYLPCLQLCVCYYRIGDAERAEAYNELAGISKPADAAYLFNKQFFQDKRRRERTQSPEPES